MSDTEGWTTRHISGLGTDECDCSWHWVLRDGLVFYPYPACPHDIRGPEGTPGPTGVRQNQS